MRVITNYSTTLLASMTSTQSTMDVTSLETKDGHTIVIGDLAAINYLVIEPGTANEEIISFTGISATGFTGLVRGLAFYGSTATSVAANRKAHQSGSTVIMSNAHYYYDQLMDLDSAETVTGVKTFTASPIVPTPSTDYQAATKKYADDLAIAGSPKATDAVYGISKLSSAASVPAAPVVLNSEEVAATTGANKVVRANASGKIDKGFLEVTADKGLEFSTNALQNKAGTGITLSAAGINVDVGTTNGKIVQMTTGDKLPAVNGNNLTSVQPTWKNGVCTMATTTIAHGLGYTPKFIKMYGGVTTGSGYSYSSQGSFNGSTYSCIELFDGNPGTYASSTTYIIKVVLIGDLTKYSTATVSVDATNITLTWAATNGGGTTTTPIVWEAC